VYFHAVVEHLMVAKLSHNVILFYFGFLLLEWLWFRVNPESFLFISFDFLKSDFTLDYCAMSNTAFSHPSSIKIYQLTLCHELTIANSDQ